MTLLGIVPKSMYLLVYILHIIAKKWVRFRLGKLHSNIYFGAVTTFDSMRNLQFILLMRALKISPHFVAMKIDIGTPLNMFVVRYALKSCGWAATEADACVE